MGSESVAFQDKPNLPEETRQAIREQTAKVLSELNAAETVNDLLNADWLMRMLVDKVLTAVEEQGMQTDGFERDVSEVITSSISELLPVRTEDPRDNPASPEDPGEHPASSGDREPRRPILPSLSGEITLDLPVDSP